MHEAKLIGITQPIHPELESADELITYCARVSNPSAQINNETAPKLINYLVAHDHWSPFEMAHMVVEITTTRDIARQILRHRSFSFQEFSQRYAEVAAPCELREARMQHPTNRQSSTLTQDDKVKKLWVNLQEWVVAVTRSVYQEALDAGIAKEVARAVLPEGMTVSKLYMSGSVRSWIHYCKLRRGNGTQLEHQQVALACQEILLQQFPSLKEHML